MNMPRSTYYYRQRRKDQKGRALLVGKIETLAMEFPRYGYRRITHQLKREGLVVNHKVVLPLMRLHGLLCKQKKRFARTTNSHHPYPIYPNLAKGFPVTGPNQLWVSDITYIRLLKGFIYLAAILDAFSRKAIGYALGENIDAQLTRAALQMAVHNRKPQPGCIHHSDRGVQYAAHEYVDLLKGSGIQISMSAKGNPYDNAMAESFMKTFKYEEVYLSDYQTFEDALTNIFKFLEDVYNKRRLHSSIGYLPPVEFEEKFIQEGSAIKVDTKQATDFAPDRFSFGGEGNSSSFFLESKAA